MKTLYELKQNLATIGQQLQKVEGELAQKAIDPSASMEDIQTLQKSKEDLKARFDVIKEQHDSMEAEQKAKFNQNQIAQQRAGFDGLNQEEKMVKAKAEFIRASIQGRQVSEEVKQLIAIPTGDPSGGDKFLPTNMQKELVHEPFAKNQLRNLARVTKIKGLEIPKIAYSIDDDDFITDKETAKEMKLTGDTVTFGRNKFKVKVKIPDTVIHGSDIELVTFVDNALRSGLAAKEKKDALAETPKTGLGHMSFYNGTDIKRVKGDNLHKAIKAAIADLHEDFRDNAKILMSYTDYMEIIEFLSNGTTNFYDAPPEKVLGKPVEFADGAVKPVVGDFNFFGINYDGMTFDTDKDVDSGDYLFVLTAWYDQKRSLNSAFRIATVDTP
ncbi:phage major capsid protein [Bacillus sp. FJAT-49732]|uniref:Phage major capsid protein n=1 Tax=Lederbergia citrisecunda TaxID=2833583 RepID=A0A942TIB8_9BACI|nr:phage major capsid protein [Lederbergia citrisecunda]MBS4198611.1 phage major capsid protein [Lederbergia citrisecunda]